MSDNPRPPRRPLGERDDKDKNQPFGSGARPGRRSDPRPAISPTDPYPWAQDEAEKPEPPPDPTEVQPTAPYPWARDKEAKPPAPAPDPSRVSPTAPYPWAKNDGEKKPPAPAPDPGRVSPTAPYPWAKDDVEKKPPAPDPDPGRVSPTAPYPWAKDDVEKKPPAPAPDPGRVSPTAPYPWSDEYEDPPAREEVDPSTLSWADLIAAVDRPDAAPPEVDIFDDAPLEPPLPSETAPSERPRITDATRFLPTEDEAPPERVTDRFLKRGSFLKRRRPGAIPARSYLEGDPDAAASAPVTIQVRPLLHSLGVILGSALLVATLFTWWTPNSFLPPASAGQLAIALATQGGPATATVAAPASPSANAIGIVSGHRGINPTSGLPDPGAVCGDGLTEESINATISVKVAQLLEAAGYHVDIFDEFDTHLQGYRALVMVSIHADSCEYINDEATGFKVASFEASSDPVRDQLLAACMIDHYAARTGKALHPGVTFDMTDYHNFRELDPQTPGVIVEVGFLYLDRDFLVTRPDDAAHGIADGIFCFLRGGDPTATPIASETLLPDQPTATPTEPGPLFETAVPVETEVPLDQNTRVP